MIRTTFPPTLAVVALALAVPMPSQAQDLQQKAAAAKQSAAQNQQALRSYTWIEKVELSLKGEVKNTTINSCRYQPGRQGAEDPIVQPPPPEKKRGIRGRVVAKKTGEMKAELEASAALVHRYVPPDPGKMQVVLNAGTASAAQAGPGVVVLEVRRVREDGRLAGPDLRLDRQGPAPDRSRHVPRRPEEPGDAARRHAVAAGRDALPGERRSGDTGQPDRSPDHEQQLPEARAVAAVPCSLDSGRAVRDAPVSRGRGPMPRRFGARRSSSPCSRARERGKASRPGPRPAGVPDHPARIKCDHVLRRLQRRRPAARGRGPDRRCDGSPQRGVRHLLPRLRPSRPLRQRHRRPRIRCGGFRGYRPR